MHNQGQETVAGGVVRRRHRGEQGWRELVERFATAGANVEQFCRREGVSRNSFERWRTRLAANRTQAGVATKSSTGFVDLGTLGAGSSALSAGLEVRIDLGGGVTLTVTRR